MSLSLIISPLAAESIAALAEQAASYSAPARLKLLAAITDKVRFIEQQPEMYPVVPGRAPVRRCVVLPHISLYYRIQLATVEIMDVLDTRRDPGALTFPA